MSSLVYTILRGLYVYSFLFFLCFLTVTVTTTESSLLHQDHYNSLSLISIALLTALPTGSYDPSVAFPGTHPPLKRGL